MADAAVSFEDPATEDFGQDIVVHGNKPAAPQPTTPAIGAPGANAAAQPVEPVGISFDDFFGTKPKAPPANDQGTAASASQPSAASAAKGISFDDFFGKPATGAGPLTNTGDESYLSGLGKGAATAAIKGLADIPGFAGNIDNLANYLIARGEHAVTGEDLDAILARHAQRNADFAKSSIVPTTAPSGADISGPILAKTGDYVPETEPGKLAQAGLEGAISALAPGGPGSPTGAAVPGIATTMAKQAPMIGASTAVGQGATDLTGDPLLGAAAGLVGGSALGAAGAAGSKIARPVIAAMPGKFGAPMAERLAGEQLAASAKDLPALRDTLEGTGGQTSTAVVPGSKPTLGQLSGDQGILMKEREARTEDVSPFNEREAQQNSARKAQIEGQAKSGADVMRVPQTFRDRLNHIDKATQQAIDTLTQRAKNAAAGLGKGETAEQRGSSIRTSIEAAKNVARAMKTRLYDAVDPEEKLNLVAAPVREKAEQIAKSLDALDEQPEGREAAILADVRALPDVMPFKSLRALDKRVTTAMKVARRAGEDTIHRRLSMLKGAVQDAIDNGVENQVAYEQAAVARGDLKPGDTIESHLADAFGTDAGIGEGNTGAVARSAGEAPEGPSSGGHANDTSGVRAASEGRGQPRANEGHQGVPREDAAGKRLGLPSPGRAPLRLTRFLAANGGLRPDPELRAIFDKENPFIPGSGKLFRKGGMSLDRAREAATEAGYIHDPGEHSRGPLETDVNDFLGLLSKDHGGDHQFPIGEESRSRQDAIDIRNVESYLRKELKGVGINPNTVGRRTLNAAVDMVRSGEQPDSILAYERAVMQDREGFGNEAAARQVQTGTIHDFDLSDASYGAPPREFAPQSDESGNARARGEAGASGSEQRNAGERNREQGQGGDSSTSLAPNFDQAAGERLKAAKDFYKNEYAPTFKEGSVAKVLAGPFSGKYNVMDSAVPSRAILKGDKGYEAAKAFIKASGKAPEAVGAMADHILDDLRDGLLPIGAVSPSKFAKWKADYAPALRALDEQIPGFSDKFSSAARATDTMMEAGRLRETAIDQFQKGAAGQLLGNLGKNEPVEVENAVGKILSDKTAGPTRMEALVKEASRDPEAVEGLKKAGVDWMLRHFSTTAEAGTSGEKLLSSANFQKFISENRATIQKLYGSEGLGMFAAVAHDLERANRPISATRIGGSPGTAHDVAPIISSGAKKVAGHTSMMVAMIEGVHLGYEHGGMKGAALAGAGGAASYLLGTLRHAGMNKVNGLVRDALLNPERARVYLSKVPVNPDSGKFLGLASAIRRQLIGLPINLENSKSAH